MWYPEGYVSLDVNTNPLGLLTPRGFCVLLPVVEPTSNIPESFTQVKRSVAARRDLRLTCGHIVLKNTEVESVPSRRSPEEYWPVICPRCGEEGWVE